MEVRRGARVGGPAARAGRRGQLRPHHRQPHPPRREVRPLAHGQGPARVRAGTAAGLTVRLGRPDDESALSRIDRATWSALSSPAPPPDASTTFFSERTLPQDVLVAERDGDVVGWAKIEHPTPFPSSEHVWTITGLAVDPDAQGGGVALALVGALADESGSRGARRLA